MSIMRSSSIVRLDQLGKTLVMVEDGGAEVLPLVDMDRWKPKRQGHQGKDDLERQS